MIKVTIKNLNGDVTHGAEFRNMPLAEAWISNIQAKSPCPWGRVAYTTETRDGEGQLVELVEHPAEFTVEIEDLADAHQWAALRLQRNQKLSECDWTQLADAPLSSGEKAEWAEYRQTLRDLPDNTEDPGAPQWPSQPE